MPRFNLRLLWLPVAAVVFAAPGASVSAQFPTDSAILSMLSDRLATKRSTGLVVGLIDGDKRRVVAVGIESGDKKLDGNSVFEIGSITKVFTGTLLADMSMRGLVKLDDPVASLLPAGVHVPSRNDRQITLEDLATQSSGLPRLPANMRPADIMNPYADYTVQQMYDFLSGYTLPRDIGAVYEYSNLGVGLLGQALALRAGKSYEQLVRDRILDPLGMKSTAITLTPAMRARLAAGHGFDGKVVSNWDLPAFAGAGALRSTVNDMLLFLRAAMSDKGPLASAFALATEPRRSAGSSTMSIGLNWHIMKAADRAVVWHNGGTGGYRTFAGFDRENHRAVVVLTNSAISSDDIGFHLLIPARPLAPAPAVPK